MFEKVPSLLSDVPRGDAGRDVAAQSAPAARFARQDGILKNKDLHYNPKAPGRKVLFGAIGETLIGIDDNRHILTVAGTRAGKTVTVLSNLFFYPGSVIALDPKGEMALRTAKAREKLNSAVYVLDPFFQAGPDVREFRRSYNPMAALDPEKLAFLEDAALIADAIVMSEGPPRDPHWDESARNFIEGLIVHVATSPSYQHARHLVKVRDLIRMAMVKSPDAEESERPALYQEIIENADRMRAEDESQSDIADALVGAAEDFYSKAGNELAGVLSTVNRHTRFLDYRAFKEVLKESDFTLEDVVNAEGGATVFICFPPTRGAVSRRWMRIFVNQLLQAVEARKAEPEVPLLAVLDEFPLLGYMPALEMAVGVMASYHVRLWFILQDWSQGNALYGQRWETFASNAGVQQFFGNTDYVTTRYVSDRLGVTTVDVEQVKSGSFNATQFPLMTADEVALYFARSDALKRQLILWAGKRPMVLQRVEYYDKSGPLMPFIKSL